MAIERCKKCGANIALVGLRHNCNQPKEFVVELAKLLPEKPEIIEKIPEIIAKAERKIDRGLKKLSCQCACCVARRKKTAEAVRRFRGKKDAPSSGRE